MTERNSQGSDALKILVVEDNHVNQRVMQHMLARLNCAVEIAEHGVEALQKLQQRAYDLIFMDCQMPVMDGYEATAAIRRLDGAAAAIPIVAITANAMAGDRERCLEAGMDDYLSKPATSTQLESMIEKWARVAV